MLGLQGHLGTDWQEVAHSKFCFQSKPGVYFPASSAFTSLCALPALRVSQLCLHLSLEREILLCCPSCSLLAISGNCCQTFVTQSM